MPCRSWDRSTPRSIERRTFSKEGARKPRGGRRSIRASSSRLRSARSRMAAEACEVHGSVLDLRWTRIREAQFAAKASAFASDDKPVHDRVLRPDLERLEFAGQGYRSSQEILRMTPEDLGLPLEIRASEQRARDTGRHGCGWCAARLLLLLHNERPRLPRTVSSRSAKSMSCSRGTSSRRDRPPRLYACRAAASSPRTRRPR